MKKKMKYLVRLTKKAQLIVFALLLSPAQVLGLGQVTLKIGPETLRFDAPNEWQYAESFLNAPLMIWGPDTGSKRVVLSIYNTKQDAKDISKKNFWGDYDKYKSIKENWLKKNSGELISFYPFEIKKITKNGKSATMGLTYRKDDLVFHEMNYFFACNDKMYTASTLVTDYLLKKYGRDLKEVLSSIECLKK
ncbi:hypothetical protein HBN50_05955 [Halobacteriovorax sp. GB3]|uniref:hypothetical protein n=1 Tax=Halobacteriovorax sp. GB3 TaxID=2719615 RepID=UPI00235F010D|nr:hypothetical protein [Halobacteriovorax sp. GB3]MDD0852630.1 hypothetical protein [Halobacteriovorax sp. GB3]